MGSIPIPGTRNISNKPLRPVLQLRIDLRTSLGPCTILRGPTNKPKVGVPNLRDLVAEYNYRYISQRFSRGIRASATRKASIVFDI
jgi:hypothetical protein